MTNQVQYAIICVEFERRQSMKRDYPKKYDLLFESVDEGLMRSEEFTFDYVKHGFSEDDIDNLSEIAIDEDLKYTNSKDDKEMYAPCHAIMALGQLKTLEPFTELMKRFDYFADDDHYSSAIGYYLRKIALKKIEFLYDYFLDRERNIYNRMLIVEVLRDIVKDHSSIKTTLEDVLVEYLQRDDELNDALNALVVFLLIDISKDKHIDLIREVFENKPVDVYYDGDLEDIEIRLGLRTKRDTPKPHLFDFFSFDEDFEDLEYNEPYIKIEPKIGRNDPCPCGSGKKYNKCCIDK